MLIALVTWWPGGGALLSWRETGEDVEQARPAQGGGAIEEEVELACLALRSDREVERYERGNVGGLPVLEYLAGTGIEVYRAGPYLVLGARAWFDYVGSGWNGLGEGNGNSSGEGEEAHNDAHDEGIHFDVVNVMVMGRE